ncbi:MAG: chromate transporter [Candidatus Muproteobacteria bacterium RIFCSPHIGHO2_02_FULL_65_16]|uniref:Chromate transporter n=1 Tax=Candidatus Muproteobacteria bacterium RIFCSPHIGHO2_02_FULL_65_16 TaxID=1817766 RepID=A0A1F6TYL0_9PROT|nr:MAG: chromate transporter [Candidatus Muproteobacteria bacterium RIFCSPHIGHO2_02_FULL_65_16]
MTRRLSLWSLFWIFFRIACTSFGGFMALISVVENVIVERKKLMKHHDMLDGISLASILPGPVAVNLVVYVGYRLRGGLGALVSAVAAILPAFVFIVVLAYAYFRWGDIPAVSRLFLGFIPAVVAVIVAAAWNMSRKSIPGWREAALAAVAAGVLLGVGGFFSTVGIIVGAGVVGWLWFRHDLPAPVKGAPAGARKKRKRKDKSFKRRLDVRALFLAGAPFTAVPVWQLDPGILLKLFLVFAGMSVMLFGGGYVFIPIIQEIVVGGHRWVTQKEFIDGVAMSQVTPGPIMVSAAFIGYKVAGLAGALAATVGIFPPPALVMLASARVLERIKRSAAIKAALRGVRPAVIGMIFAAAVVVGKTAAPVWLSGAIFAAALFALLRLRLEAVWIIPTAGLLGLLLY